jgi:hypothetical protein
MEPLLTERAFLVKEIKNILKNQLPSEINFAVGVIFSQGCCALERRSK